MSELIKIRSARVSFRKDLLATVSAGALLAAVVVLGSASASEDAARPTVWLELGGQLERIDGGQDVFAPPFALLSPIPEPYRPLSPVVAQKPSAYSYGAEGEISFRPGDSDWLFSASLRYGRSNNNKHIHQQSSVQTRFANPLYGAFGPAYVTGSGPQFFDARVKNEESHTIIDFQIGRDVGLGMFSHALSSVSLGVRVAQFNARTHVKMIARPELEFYPVTFAGNIFAGGGQRHTDYWATADNARSFSGLGPSVSWSASAPITRGEDAGISLDWGINAAVLFGRQKARGEHNETARLYRGKYYETLPPYGVVTLYQPGQKPHNRSRSVVVPNVGGFAGVSFRYAAAKVSFGYRGDFFFGAVDTGIDARHTVDRNFYGPFATISIGLP